MIQKALPDSSVDDLLPDGRLVENFQNSATLPEERPQRSTLIEFPGNSRPVPEWRRQLSQRVREVQERKAREAAEEMAAAMAAGVVNCSLPSAQLELVPDLGQPALNPIVSKALERLERARRPDSSRQLVQASTAASLLPIEESSMAPLPEFAPPEKPKLVVVTPAPVEQRIEPTVELKPGRPIRIITDEVENVALSYLDACLRTPAIETEDRYRLAGFPRRIIAGTFDLLLTAVMVSPLAAAIVFYNLSWSDPRALTVMTGVSIVTLFAYLTLSIAVTGRTLSMRMLGLKTIDLRTGLIPTGGQSIKRALGYIFSLAALGLGLIYAFVDRDHRTAYDHFSKTIVVRS